MSQRSLPCKLYDEITLQSRLASAGVMIFFFWSAKNFCAETVCMKASYHNFKPKQHTVEGDETCACFASFGPRSLRIGLQRVSKPSTEVDQSSCTSPGPTEFAHSKISGNIMPIVIFEHMAPSSCVRTKQTRPVHSAHEDLNREKKQIGLHPSPALAGRNVCKRTVVRVEKQAALCRQIGSFPW